MIFCQLKHKLQPQTSKKTLVHILSKTSFLAFFQSLSRTLNEPNFALHQTPSKHHFETSSSHTNHLVWAEKNWYSLKAIFCILHFSWENTKEPEPYLFVPSFMILLGAIAGKEMQL